MPENPTAADRVRLSLQAQIAAHRWPPAFALVMERALIAYVEDAEAAEAAAVLPVNIRSASMVLAARIVQEAIVGTTPAEERETALVDAAAFLVRVVKFPKDTGGLVS